MRNILDGLTGLILRKNKFTNERYHNTLTINTMSDGMND